MMRAYWNWWLELPDGVWIGLWSLIIVMAVVGMLIPIVRNRRRKR